MKKYLSVTVYLSILMCAVFMKIIIHPHYHHTRRELTELIGGELTFSSLGNISKYILRMKCFNIIAYIIFRFGTYFKRCRYSDG